MKHRFPLGIAASAFVASAALVTLSACAEVALLPEAQTQGPSPKFGEVQHTLSPTLHIADAQGWPAGAMPKAHDGWRVTAFASGLSHPRWLMVLPYGDVLVAESY